MIKDLLSIVVGVVIAVLTVESIGNMRDQPIPGPVIRCDHNDSTTLKAAFVASVKLGLEIHGGEKQLIDNAGGSVHVVETPVLALTDESRWRKFLCREPVELRNRLRVAVITAIGHDNVTVPHLSMEQREEGVDYYLFAPQKSTFTAPNQLWNVILHPYPRLDLHPDHRVVYYKTQAHTALPGYDVYVWADYSYTLQAGHAKYFTNLVRQGGMAIGRHLQRATVKDELAATLLSGSEYFRMRNESLKAQFNAYTRNGFSDSRGLFATGLLAYYNSPCTRQLFDTWWMENAKWSIQDQLSLPYVLSEFDVHPVTFDNSNGDSQFAKGGRPYGHLPM